MVNQKNQKATLNGMALQEMKAKWRLLNTRTHPPGRMACWTRKRVKLSWYVYTRK